MAVFKNTDRELALIEGRDPDELPVEEEVSETVEQEVQAEVEAATEQDAEVAEAEVSDDQPEITEDVAGKDAPAQVESWVTAEDRDYARDLDLSDEDLSSFASREEFVRAAKLADKQRVASLKKEIPAEKAVEQPVAKDDPLDPKKWDEYADDTKTLVQTLRDERAAREAMAKQLEAQQAQSLAVQQYFAQQAHAAKLNSFHDVLDSLEPEFFGKSTDEKGKYKSLDAAHNGNREKVWKAKEELEAVYAHRGQQPPPEKVLIQRAKELALGDEIRKAEKAKLSKTLAAQSRQRRPVAGSKPIAAGVKKEDKRTYRTIEEQAAEIANLPQVAKAWTNLQQE
jgi:hypothetical protein